MGPPPHPDPSPRAPAPVSGSPAYRMPHTGERTLASPPAQPRCRARKHTTAAAARTHTHTHILRLCSPHLQHTHTHTLLCACTPATPGSTGLRHYRCGRRGRARGGGGGRAQPHAGQHPAGAVEGAGAAAWCGVGPGLGRARQRPSATCQGPQQRHTLMDSSTHPMTTWSRGVTRRPVPWPRGLRLPWWCRAGGGGGAARGHRGPAGRRCVCSRVCTCVCVCVCVCVC